MNYDDLVEIALTLPDVEEGMSYGAPAIKRKGRFMFAPKRDGKTVAIKLDWETHDRLLAERPDVFFKTPHYSGYPAFLVRCELLSKAQAVELIDSSWKGAPQPAKMRRSIG